MDGGSLSLSSSARSKSTSWILIAIISGFVLSAGTALPTAFVESRPDLNWGLTHSPHGFVPGSMRARTGILTRVEASGGQVEQTERSLIDRVAERGSDVAIKPTELATRWIIEDNVGVFIE